MSEFFGAYLIPVCLLGFYAPVLAIRRYWPAQQKPQLLKWIHLGGWGFSLLLVVVFVTWRVSLRGQWPDVLPFTLAWLAAGSYFLLRRKQMNWASKLYFGSWFIYPGFLAATFLLDRILFVTASIPVFLLMPQTEPYHSSNYTIRSANSLIGPPQITLLTPLASVLERQQGTSVNVDGRQYGALDSTLTLRVVSSAQDDTTAVIVSTASRQFQIQFTR
ncbi:hypothetical protein HNQ93_002296 [Hymenobacter luteus]|uniref:Uncharacterized protein n=2 Tax=Hymenobacter TaxID=89966 RepID=A0A7W9WCJ2_9BACT|nr:MULTISPECIES: hypothetical protein [Hymenobacter]MBB4602135.1 hypothetical protein [Hymenobacter latericoloratus]MBB6059436.1 hypothetical protein [Hymenobacter luteus]